MIDRREARDDNALRVAFLSATPLPNPRPAHMPSAMMRRCFTLALLLCWSASVHAQVAVSGFSPGALAPGKTTELTLTGQKFEDPLAVWTSFPAQLELLPAEPTQRKLKIT